MACADYTFRDRQAIAIQIQTKYDIKIRIV